MAGYAATVRIERASVRRRAASPTRLVTQPVPTPIDEREAEWAPDTPSLLADLRDRLGSLAEAWAQTTFYLTDPNSWR